jgi:hypothetical protein
MGEEGLRREWEPLAFPTKMKGDCDEEKSDDHFCCGNLSCACPNHELSVGNRETDRRDHDRDTGVRE